jgi:nucleoside-diphosphate-sugar epimerase
MRVLILGGGGNIGFWVEHELVSRGHEVTTVSRGTHRFKRRHRTNSLLSSFTFDINSGGQLDFLCVTDFDCVIDFVLYDGLQATVRTTQFSMFTGLYIFISTVAVYKRKPGLNVLTSKSVIENPRWKYARNKLVAEGILAHGLRSAQLKIARVAHTFDIALPVPFGPGDWTVPYRILRGHPMLTHRYFESEWPLLHSSSVASRLALLVETPNEFQQVCNLAAGYSLSWSNIVDGFFHALNLKPNVKLLPVEDLASLYPYWADSVVYHKQFDERYVGPEIEYFESVCNDICLAQGLRSSIDLYVQNAQSCQSYNESDLEYAELEKYATEI